MMTDNWNRWGAEDERGTLNLIDADAVRAALTVPTAGKVYQLGLPVQRTDIPLVDYRGAPQRLALVNHLDEHMYESFGGTPGVGCHEDVIHIASHTSTHMDALCHVYADGMAYNGNSNSEMEVFAGATKLGIEKSGPVFTRGVLVDVAGTKGVPWLEPGYVITPDDLREAIEANGTGIRPGDAILVRTGWVEWFYATGREMSLVQPGIGLDAADFLATLDPGAVCSDNTAIEAQPFDQGKFLGSHVILLQKHGIHLIEHLSLAELAADGVREFLFCTIPLKVTGATASPVNPIAIA